MGEFAANFGHVMSQLDLFLLMTVSLALVVGVVGIINTMLMSTTERFVEFGVLRTNGWSRGNVLSLVTLESAYLGLMSGVVGCVMAFALTQIANQFIGGGSLASFHAQADRPGARPLRGDGHAGRPVPGLEGVATRADGRDPTWLALTAIWPRIEHG